jgi:hypothetical protein
MQASELSQRIKKHSAPLTCAALSTCGRAQEQIPISSEAIEMAPVSAGEWFHTPSSMEEWDELRLEFLAAQKEK